MSEQYDYRRAHQYNYTIQEAVERSISSSGIDRLFPGSKDNSSPTGHQEQSLPSIQFPSLDRNAVGSVDDLIMFTDRNMSSDAAHQANEMELTSGVDPLYSSSFWTSNYDILTTDLFNFFPTDST